MPTYEYVCQVCGHAFEQFQPMSAKPTKKCPKCGKQKVKRLIGTGAGVIFKGSGFYETDYRSDSYKKAAKADKDAASGKSENKSETKDKPAGDTKPAKPADNKDSPKKKTGD